MKTVVLCGGLGTRLREETVYKPKPMIEVGGRPILWHIMKIYANFGFKEFILALGYKGEMVKDYFINYQAMENDVRVDLGTGEVSILPSNRLDWQVHMVDTGMDSMTGGRLHRLAPLLKDEGTFMLTYGDGVADVDISELVSFHRRHGKLATVTAVRPPARFGNIALDGDTVMQFEEKRQTEGGWINGGFFVFEPGVFEYFEGDHTVLEGQPLENLARDGQLVAYRHTAFWQCMDTLRDLQMLEEMWTSSRAQWKVWDD